MLLEKFKLVRIVCELKLLICLIKDSLLFLIVVL